MSDVGKHTSKDDAWLVLFGEAIDVTAFLPVHPGGEESILTRLGQDATEEWQAIHKPGTLEKYAKLMIKKGRVKGGGGLLAWLFGRLGQSASSDTAEGGGSIAPAVDGGKTEDGDALGVASDAADRVQWQPERHERELPQDRIFTLETLARWDGVKLPMFIGICGNVIDVSSSDNFTPDHGYGMLWAGKDTTLAMATVSLKKQDANRFDFSLGDLEEAQFSALAGWYKHFTHKYPTVGTLAEYQNWDFSPIEMKAESMPAPKM